MKISYKLLLILALTLFLLQLDYLFADIMEARNFVSAREMVEDNHWIYTTLNGEIRYQKPPLPTWFSAIMGYLFGTETLWALRFPAALSCSFLILYFYDFLKRTTQDKQLALVSSLIFCTSFLVIFIGKRATWDIYCYSFGFIGIYYFYRSFLSKGKDLLSFSLAGLFLGFSILSKGPTGIYVIAAPFFLSYWMVYGFPKVKWMGWLWMVFLALLVGFSWYIFIYFTDHQNFVSIMEEEFTARSNRDVKPFTRYFSFPLQMGVWAIFAVISLAFPYVKRKTPFPKAYVFFFGWTLLCLIFLSLVPSKKERYLFPLMIPLSATTGFYVYYLLKNQNWKKWERMLTRFSFGLVAVVSIMVPLLLFVGLKVKMSIYSITFSVSAVLIGLYLFRQIGKVFNLQNAFLATICFVASATLLGIPIIDDIFTNNPNHHSILLKKESIQNSGLKLYGFHVYSPEIWFKYGEIIPNMDFDNPSKLPQEHAFYFFSMANENPEHIQNKMNEMGYSIQFIEEFDDNETQSGKNNTDRKKLKLFKAERK